MMKRAFLILLLSVLSLSAFAERENYIILFDCTASMKGSDGGPDVWEEAKEILTESILNINGDDARIIVIPFQDKIGNISDFPASDKSRINQIMADLDKMITTKHRGTSICRAWDVGLKYIEEGCLNYMFLLTDGADNIILATGAPVKLDKNGKPATDADAVLLDECTENVCVRIRKWCDFGANNIAFYSRLTQSAQVAKIEEAAKGCKNISFTDGLNIAQLKTREITVNVADFASQQSEVRIPVKLTNALSGKASVVPVESSTTYEGLFNMTLASGGFLNGDATLVITPVISYDELRTKVGNAAKVKAKVEVDPASRADLNISLCDLTINIVGNPESVIKVDVKNSDLGKAQHYRKFLWKKASVPDTLYTYISFDLNEYAESDAAEVEFRLSSESGEDCEFFVDGENSSSFKVNADAEVSVGVVMAPDAQEGIHVVEIHSVGKGVDRIDNARLEIGETWETHLSGRYNVRTNPLKVTFIVIILVLLGLFIFWMTIMRYRVFPRFKNTFIRVTKGKEELPKRSKGYIRCVITSSPNRQGALMNFLAGPVLYFQMSPSDGVTEDIVIEPYDKRSVTICRDKTGTYHFSLSRLKITTVGQPSPKSEVISQHTRKTIIMINIQ